MKTIRALYIDTLSAKHALTNTNGIIRAYQKRADINLFTFDYRTFRQKWGKYALNLFLIYYTLSIKPDFIHLGKGEGIFGLAIFVIKLFSKCKVIHFYGDFRWIPKPHVVRIGRYADITLLYHKQSSIIEQYLSQGVNKIGFWWVGTDTSVFFDKKLERKYDVVFFGVNTNEQNDAYGQDYAGRIDLLEKLAVESLNVHIYGSGWEQFANVKTFSLHPFVNNDDFSSVCSQAKIVIGYNSSNAYFYHSWRRAFNSMACGALYLVKHFPGLDEVFENKKHIVCFSSNNEAISLIKTYLKNPDILSKVATLGQEIVRKKHSWDNRISEMIEIYLKL